MESGVERFIDDMIRYGFDCEVDDGLVVFGITPVEGAHAGDPIETGVSKAELDPWPQVPPHWIHLPASITFPKTNSKPSSRSGWLRA